MEEGALSVGIDITAAENLFSDQDLGDARNLIFFVRKDDPKFGGHLRIDGMRLQPLVDLLFAKPKEF
jgi:hypothetical protein